MKLQKQAKVPTIEIDLSRIQQLSQEHDDENWKFRSWLKQYAPDDIDGLVRTLSRNTSPSSTARSPQIAADHCTLNSRKVSFMPLQKRLASR
jgi:hypothetical protein